jgi:hypothetical protein
VIVTLIVAFSGLSLSEADDACPEPVEVSLADLVSDPPQAATKMEKAAASASSRCLNMIYRFREEI